MDCVAEFNRYNVTKAKQEVVKVHEKIGSCDTQILQIDAGVFEDSMVAFGCVLRSPLQGISLAACSSDKISVDPAVAEALAIRWGLRLAKDLKVERVLVQSDALLVVDCINSIQPFAVIEPIAADFRDLLASFNVSSIMFISRNCNSDAHNLVSWGKQLGSRTWLNGAPVGVPTPSVPFSLH